MVLSRQVFLLGGSGQLGSAIRRTWPCKIIAPTHVDLDIVNASAVRAAIVDARADLVLNCAAFHNVDNCEAEPESAFAANALAVNALAQFCASRNICFMTFSTDYVFDGE